MNRRTTLIPVVASALLAVFATACGDGATDLSRDTVSPIAPPSYGPVDVANGLGDCMFKDAQDAGYSQAKLQCVAEDIDIAFTTVNEYRVYFPGDPLPPFVPLADGERISCLPGQLIEVDTELDLENNAQARYDIGLWINPDPDEADPIDPGFGANYGTQCLHYNLINDENGASVLDNTPDQCGDMAANVLAQVPLDVLTLECSDPDGNGLVDLDACTAWENNTTGQGEVICPLTPPGRCKGFREGTVPGTGSKCKCTPLGLPIDIKSVLRIAKVTVPSPSEQEFTFQPDFGVAFQLSDGETWMSDPLSADDYAVAETVPGGWDLTNVMCVNTDAGDTDPVTYSVVGSEVTVTLGQADDVTCTFTNTQRGEIIVVKQTDPDGSTQLFDFTSSYGAPFQLSDGQSNNSGYLTAGTYSVAETVPAGWELKSATCSDSSDPASIDLSPGETVTCTFTNEQDAFIIVEKQTDPDGATQLFDFTSDYGAPFQLSDGQTNNSGALDPGTYSVAETAPSGWVLSSATCDDGSDPGSINLSAGETVTCTFNNTQDALIIVDKVTDPAEDPQVFNFTGTACGPFTLTDTQEPKSCTVAPDATYSVAESVPTGWDLTSAICDNGDGPAAITPTAGETVICAFTNTKRGKIIVEKQTDPDGSTQQFDFTSDYGSPFSLADGGTNDSGFLMPGTYSVAETVPSGWDLTSATCSDGSDPASIGLDPGETVTCTFNNRQRGNIVVVKNTIGGDGTFDFTTGTLPGGAFSLTTSGGTDQTAFNDLIPGTYDVAETDPTPMWDLTSASCDDGSDPASIGLDPGETVTCTFNNTKRGNVKIIKNTIGGDGTFGYNSTLPGGAFSLITVDNTDNADYPNVVPGSYSVQEVDPTPGFDFVSVACVETETTNTTTSQGTRTATINVDPGEDVTCTFTNRERAMVTLLKTFTVARTIDPTLDFVFNVYAGPDGFGSTVLASSSTLGDGDGVLVFGGIKLNTEGTYTMCELNVPAGWTVEWTIDAVPVTPYNPNSDDPTPEDLGNRCIDFGSGTPYPLTPGETLPFAVNNTPPPEGDPRTIGYWKNWNSCTNGNQARTAANNGGAAEGFFLLEDVLPLYLGLDDPATPLPSDDERFIVSSCEVAVSLLDKRDVDSGRKRASDGAYALAAQLVAALANTSPGVDAGCTPGNFDAQVAAAQQLLFDIEFDGTGRYLRPKDAEYSQARSLASFFDDYNNGMYCAG